MAKPKKDKRTPMPRGKNSTRATDKRAIESYEHRDKERVNNPPAGLVTPETDPDAVTKKTPIEKFQSLLRELFQFDCADLDFGIYRIMNYKRAVIERFITEELPNTVSKELKIGALAEQAQAQQALTEARQKVLDALGEDALDADGNLTEAYRNTKAGKEYLEAQAKAQAARSTEALEAAVYNHLYTFFSRYWEEGDFISKRRYSKKERYAIPYNGEEVYLYWANRDQYYIKTGEYFTDYTFQAPNGVTVHFTLRHADVEQNNVKGEKRFFLPRLDEIAWDEAARTLTIPFEFRPLTAQEAVTYGQKNQQEAIIAKAVTEVPKRIEAAEALSALIAERRRTEKGEPVSWLEHHLRQYTRMILGLDTQVISAFAGGDRQDRMVGQRVRLEGQVRHAIGRVGGQRTHHVHQIGHHRRGGRRVGAASVRTDQRPRGRGPRRRSAGRAAAQA